MNFRQRTSRYGAGVMFSAGLAGIFLVVASINSGLRPSTEIWLGAALVVSLIMHARLGFAFSKAQAEIEMLRKLVSRCDEDPAKSARKLAPLFKQAPPREISQEDAAILERVKNAIEGDRVELYLQPIVTLPGRKSVHYEAFSRLRDSDGSVLRPADYLDAAERANRIGVIDSMILLRCVQAFRRLKERDGQFSVFCNLSPATLFDTDFFNHFTDYLEANSDLSSRLIFEFTYPAIHMTHPRFEENLKAIARKGFAFSVDHVHSLDIDWSALRSRNFRYVKAPAALLRTVAASHDGREKIELFRRRLEECGIELIAEKIELEAQLPEVIALGVKYAQGNLFGPAQRAETYVGRDIVEPESGTKSAAA